ncbi:helix-turn-helix domain-containing protein [Candidatus Phyllobacterium onerii]|uniref:helix-turn-helix domain-containing protein n=1 Tax=Candidatus Phyllobacterium onerii TaxID=3020828 RepID=UPI00232B6F19|nr:AraC family transcriptional regulator [Phyllobacterium sp. IY22]
MCRKQKVEKFIDAHLDQRITISELASLVGLSSSQFQRAFKQSFGEATHMYLIKRRIERAKTMMLSRNENFADIALACGFSDQSHMTRLFTRLVGEPPNSWRRNRVYA